jgi:LacI family transcriptional regulator
MRGQGAKRITLVFNANKVYDREIIRGVGEYLQKSRTPWDVYLDEDYLWRMRTFDVWAGDGVIADMDNPEIEQATRRLTVPVVGVGGSYHRIEDYPPATYVATDNQGIAAAAYAHLKEKGLHTFAFYGLPPSSYHRWAAERERAFRACVEADAFECHVYRGFETRPDSWPEAVEQLASWLRQVPKPLGIMATTDSRARHILQVCDQLEIMVPDEVAVIGVDDDDVACDLSPTPLSSVGQACREMGYRAARLLHHLMSGYPVVREPQVVAPTGVVARQSTDCHQLNDAYVMQAMHYIRKFACRGIKVEHVLEYVGLSRSSLEKRFRSERGHSIHREIHNARLARVCYLLKHTDKPIADVAECCGFLSVQYLYAMFKKHMGITPLGYRTGTTDQPASSGSTPLGNAGTTDRPAPPGSTPLGNAGTTDQPASPGSTPLGNAGTTDQPASPGSTTLGNAGTTDQPASPGSTTLCSAGTTDQPVSFNSPTLCSADTTDQPASFNSPALYSD